MGFARELLGICSKVEINLKKKNFYITLQLVTHSVVRFYMPMSCDGDSFRFTRHPLITLTRVSSWYAIIYIVNSLVTLSTLISGDERFARIFSTYSTRYKVFGDEWVTSALKWITAVTKRVSITCSVEGDELTIYVKILFFKALLATMYVFGV